MNPVIDEAEASAIWIVLQEECGAGDFWRKDFLQSRKCLTEFRFQGLLGFGGKFWNANRRWYVTYYSEDETPERRLMIEKANQRLAELKKGQK